MKISASVADLPSSFSPFLFVGDLFQGMDRAIEIGYDTVELFVLDPVETGIERIAEAVESRGLAVGAIGPGLCTYRFGWSLTHPEADFRRKALDRLMDSIHLAGRFRTSVNMGGMRAGLAEDPDLARRQRGWFLESIRAAAEFAGSLGVEIGMEPLNRYETNYLNTAAEALEFVEKVGLPNVGLLLDAFHMNIEERSLEEAIAAAEGRIVNFHFADSNRWAPGWGHTDLAGVLGKLRAVGYDRYLGMEILKRPTAEEAASQALSYTRKLLES